VKRKGYVLVSKARSGGHRSSDSLHNFMRICGGSNDLRIKFALIRLLAHFLVYSVRANRTYSMNIAYLPRVAISFTTMS